MDIENIRDYCLLKKGVTEELPFDETTLVFKVMGKIFLITDVRQPWSISIKCDPEKAISLREEYSEVTPAWQLGLEQRRQRFLCRLQRGHEQRGDHQRWQHPQQYLQSRNWQ